jgi:hypothetical protein
MGACAEHARKLREVAQAVGFALELIPVRSAFSDALDQAGFVGWQPSPEVRVAIEAVARIVDERTRQTRAEGYTAAHDDEHDEGELAKAAVCYAIPSDARAMVEDPCWLWPFEPSSFKPSPDDRLRELAKAGALILAEMERIARANARETFGR